MSIQTSSKEQEELILQNEGLVYYLVQQLGVAPNNSDYEDLASIGKIGLIKAARSYDKSKEIKFGTYATRCINNEFFMHFRKEKKHANNLSLDAPIGTDKEGKELTLDDIISSPAKDVEEEIVQREKFIKYISIILNSLKSKERLVMLYNIAGFKQTDIAKILNISQSYVSRIVRNLNKKIKKYYNSKQDYKGVFSMEILGNSYKITLSSKDVSHFNVIFSKVLQNLKSATSLPEFKVSYNKERIVIQVPTYPESFAFIARIIQEIDDFSISCAADKPMLKEKDNN